MQAVEKRIIIVKDTSRAASANQKAKTENSINYYKRRKKQEKNRRNKQRGVVKKEEINEKNYHTL